MKKELQQNLVPVWEKSLLTLDEANAYTGIGKHKLCDLAAREDCTFILWIGKKRMFKRKKLDEFIEHELSL